MALSSKPNDGALSNKGDSITPEDVKTRQDGQRVSQQEEKREETLQEMMARHASGEIANRSDEGYIVLEKQVPDGEGGVKVVKHGPMPRGEWDEYARKHGL